MDDPFAPEKPGTQLFQLCIEEVLDDPITSRETAEDFLRGWMYDGFGFPLRDNLWEIRSIFSPERFDVLQQRLREMDDDAPWLEEYKTLGPSAPINGVGFWSEGEVIEEILTELKAAWDEECEPMDDDPEPYEQEEPREYTEEEDALYGVPVE